jgi:hypothetical protein
MSTLGAWKVAIQWLTQASWTQGIANQLSPQATQRV